MQMLLIDFFSSKCIPVDDSQMLVNMFPSLKHVMQTKWINDWANECRFAESKLELFGLFMIRHVRISIEFCHFAQAGCYLVLWNVSAHNLVHLVCFLLQRLP